MGGRSRCAGGDLKPLKAGLLYPKGLTDGLPPLEEKPVENQEEIKRKNLYGQAK